MMKNLNNLTLITIIALLSALGCRSERKSGEEIFYGTPQGEMTLSEKYSEKIQSVQERMADKFSEASREDSLAFDLAIATVGSVKGKKLSAKDEKTVDGMLKVAKGVANRRDRAESEYVLLALERDTLIDHRKRVINETPTDWAKEAKTYADKKTSLEKLSILYGLPLSFMVDAVQSKLESDREGMIRNIDAMTKAEAELLAELKNAAALFGTTEPIQPFEQGMEKCVADNRDNTNEWERKWDTNSCQLDLIWKMAKAIPYPKFPGQ